MQNHYATLGLNSSASAEEIRRAYRILARRYHPDVNPGKASEEKFKSIAQAYEVLSDGAKRKNYDQELGSKLGDTHTAHRSYRRQAQNSATQKYYQHRAEEVARQARAAAQREAAKTKNMAKQGSASEEDFTLPLDGLWDSVSSAASGLRQGLKSILKRGAGKARAGKAASNLAKVSLIEVSLRIDEAIQGVKRAIEISEPEGTRKVSVKIPPGVRNGSLVRLRSKGDSSEELVLVIRVAQHPYLSIQQRGLVMEVPISVAEAINGASITVPTLDEPVMLKVPAGTQSGDELRLKEKGIVPKEGARGDLFVRFLIKVPDAKGAAGLEQKASELDRYYGANLRQAMPKRLLQA